MILTYHELQSPVGVLIAIKRRLSNLQKVNKAAIARTYKKVNRVWKIIKNREYTARKIENNANKIGKSNYIKFT